MFSQSGSCSGAFEGREDTVPSTIHIRDRSISSEEVVERIEDVVASIIEGLDGGSIPEIRNETLSKRFTLSGSRGLASILMVLSYSHSLLQQHRSTTTREVYYFFVTHFRHQRECEQAIWDTAQLLGVPRMSLGLTGSPKGWFCGSVKIIRNDTVTDAEALSSMQGLPITKEWMESVESRDFHLRSTAKCILVIEKEGIYNRLSEDRIFDRYPCILVTGKGFPDVATRALVHAMHQQFRVPVYGICDCNPFGLGVLHTYYRASQRTGIDGNRYSVPIQWLGLRPSHLKTLRDHAKLPTEVYQQMTDNDRKKLASFLLESHEFHGNRDSRLRELQTMQELGFKVELEALQWIGMNYISEWIYDALVNNSKGKECMI